MSSRSCVASFMALLVLGALPCFAAEAKKDAAKPAAPVVPVFSLDRSLSEAPAAEDLLFSLQSSETLRSYVTRLKKAKDDASIRAIVLVLDGSGSGIELTQLQEVRQAIDELRAAGKDVFAYAESLSTGSYLALAGATRISVAPTAMVWIGGLATERPYLRGLLDKIHVQPDFLTCGDYKSAGEIFTRTGPSPEAKRMDDWMLDSLFDSYVGLVAAGRKASPERVRGWIDGGLYTAAKAQQLGIIDKVQHREGFIAEVKAKAGANAVFDRRYGKKKSSTDIDLSSPFGLIKLWGDMLGAAKKKAPTSPAVGIVYVDGGIDLGKASPSFFGESGGAYSTEIRRALEDAAADNAIKAVVLRVNSPGGSATASEIILDAAKRLAAKKPLVVSMGGVAASGGYYVSCGSDTIYADSTTITGSIGVVSGKVATTAAWSKIGVNWNRNSRGRNNAMLSSQAVFTPSERQTMQAMMDDVYAVFKGHVVAARGSRLKMPIDQIAGGRVYTGRQALELGLVDKLGTLDDAIRAAAARAKLAQYDVRTLPKPKSIFEALFEDLGDEQKDNDRVSSLDATVSAHPKRTLLDAAMPHLTGLEANRLRAIRRALGQLEALQEHKVLMAMPEMLVGDGR